MRFGNVGSQPRWNIATSLWPQNTFYAFLQAAKPMEDNGFETNQLPVLYQLAPLMLSELSHDEHIDAFGNLDQEECTLRKTTRKNTASRKRTSDAPGKKSRRKVIVRRADSRNGAGQATEELDDEKSIIESDAEGDGVESEIEPGFQPLSERKRSIKLEKKEK